MNTLEYCHVHGQSKTTAPQIRTFKECCAYSIHVGMCVSAQETGVEVRGQLSGVSPLPPCELQRVFFPADPFTSPRKDLRRNITRASAVAAGEAHAMRADNQSPRGGAREPTLKSCPLTFTCALWGTHTHAHTQAYTHANVKKSLKIKKDT